MFRSNRQAHPRYEGVYLESGHRDGLGDCSICQDTMRSGDRRLTHPDCGNAFHEECLVTWLDRNPSCPLCRGDIRPKNSNRRRPSPPMDANSIRAAIRQIDRATERNGRSNGRRESAYAAQSDTSSEANSNGGFPRNNFRDDGHQHHHHDGHHHHASGRHGRSHHVVETRTVESRNGGPRYVTETRTVGGGRHRPQPDRWYAPRPIMHYINQMHDDDDSSSDSDDDHQHHHHHHHHHSSFGRGRTPGRSSSNTDGFFGRSSVFSDRWARWDDWDRDTDRFFSRGFGRSRW